MHRRFGTWGEPNVHLPDDLERRVKAALISVSEVWQQALLKAVEAAESARPSLGDAVAGAYRQGAQAGEQWARAARPSPADVAAWHQRLNEHPRPITRPRLGTRSVTSSPTAWEAGFVSSARAVARASVDVPSASDPAPDATPDVTLDVPPQ